MALGLLHTKTKSFKVTDADELVLGPFTCTREVRIVADVMVFVDVSSDGVENHEREGYPVVDFSPETITVPQGHHVHILGSEEGTVWLTEIQ